MTAPLPAAIDFAVLWPFRFVDSQWIERLGWTLLHSLWQFAAVAGLLIVCRRVQSRHSAGPRYVVACTALVTMLALAAVTFAAIRIPDHVVAAADPVRPAVTPAQMIDASPAPVVAPLRMESPASRASVSVETRRTSTVAGSPRAAAFPAWRDRFQAAIEPWLATVVAAWLAGVLLLSARPLAGWWTVHRLRRVGTTAVPSAVTELLHRTARRLGVRRAVMVLQSKLVEVPAVVGCFRPLVLLPASVLTGLSMHELEAVLAHELAHIRRNDYVVNLVQTVVETLFFYHPAVWWVSGCIRHEREDCCDDLAVSLCGDRAAYAGALVALEQLRGANAFPAPAMSAAGGSLLSRIRRIVARAQGEDTATTQRHSPVAAAALVALLFMAVAVVCFAPPARLIGPASSLHAEDTQPKPTTIRPDGRKPMPNSIRVNLKLDRAEFLLGESIAVDYEMTNTGQEPAPYEVGGYFPDLRISDGYRMTAVPVDETGKPIGKPVANWPLPEDHGGKVGNFTLKPDESRATTLFVTRYLRFTEPGRYRLRIENAKRDEQAVYSAGETFLTLKQPSPAEARGVFERMKQAPQKAYDDNAMKFLRGAADFDAIHQPVYLPVLKESAEQGDADALRSLERMERADANAVLVAVLARSLERDDWKLARTCYRHLKSSLPFPNWFDEPMNEYDTPHREKVSRAWKPEFGPALNRLARRLNVEVAAMMRQRETQPADVDANDEAFLDLFRRGMFPSEHPQSLLGDIDYIYRCVGRPEDFADCLSAFEKSIELTKTLPMEMHQYFRPRGSAFGFQHAVFRMLQRGVKPPARPSHTGEAAAFAIALRSQQTFRPAGWHAELMKWLKHDTPYLVELIVDHLPEPVSEEMLNELPRLLAHEYVDLQIAACHIAEKHPRPAFHEPLKKILETAKDPYLRKYAVDAARANGLKAKYDRDAPFVDPAENDGDQPAAENEPIGTALEDWGLKDPTKLAVFQIPEAAVLQAKDLAAAELSRRSGLKGRRPLGLGDLDSPEAIRSAVAQTMRDLADDTLKWEATARLRYLGDAAFDAAVAGTKSDNPFVARICCGALQHRGAKAIPALTHALKSAADASVRSAAAEALGQTFQPSAAPALIAALDDADSGVRASVIHALKYPRDRRAIEPLRRFTDDPGLGHVATQAIQHIEQPQGYVWWPPESLKFWQLCQDAHTLRGEQFAQAELDQLVRNLASDNGSIVSASLLALGDLDVRSSVVAIVAAPASELKFQVLAKLGTPEAIEHVVVNLHSANASFKEVAVSGLANGAGRWGAPLLVALLDDPALKVAQRGDGNPASGREDQLDDWPEWHRAHSALYQFLYRFGLKGRMLNLYEGQRNNVPEEILRLKTWWKQHGNDFVAGKEVPNPELTMVWYIDP